MDTIQISKIQVSKTNPRKYFDEKALAELTESVKKHGVLQPILIRSINGNGTYELVAGERRYRAAKAAGLVEIPAVVRTLTDKETLEVQVIENLQRADLHPMEEADGYRQLMKHGYDAAKIAERVGRSVKYVYDRIKLLNLIPEVSKAFTDGKITAGHAIILARLSPKDQSRAADKDVNGSGLWTHETLLWNPEGKDDGDDRVKPVSVRELQAWVDEHVRFDAKSADPMLFPEIVETVQTSAEKAEKIIQITYDYQVRPEARDANERIYGPRSWRRAEGKSKPCEYATTGIIVVGYGRGETFKVCVERKKCDVHWREEKREAAARAKRMATGEGNSQERYRKEDERRREEQAQQEAQRVIWKKSAPAILKAVAERIQKAPTKAGGLLSELVLGACNDRNIREDVIKPYMNPGKSAEDLLRYAAFTVLMAEVLNDWSAPREFPKRAKALGIDLKMIMEAENANKKTR